MSATKVSDVPSHPYPKTMAAEHQTYPLSIQNREDLHGLKNAIYLRGIRLCKVPGFCNDPSSRILYVLLRSPVEFILPPPFRTRSRFRIISSEFQGFQVLRGSCNCRVYRFGQSGVDKPRMKNLTRWNQKSNA